MTAVSSPSNARCCITKRWQSTNCIVHLEYHLASMNIMDMSNILSSLSVRIEQNLVLSVSGQHHVLPSLCPDITVSCLIGVRTAPCPVPLVSEQHQVLSLRCQDNSKSCHVGVRTTASPVISVSADNTTVCPRSVRSCPLGVRTDSRWPIEIGAAGRLDAMIRAPAKSSQPSLMKTDGGLYW